MKTDLHSCKEINMYIKTHCNTLQHTATHCNTLQHTATCWLFLAYGKSGRAGHTGARYRSTAPGCDFDLCQECWDAASVFNWQVCCSVAQRVAACCSVLQRVAACCSVFRFESRVLRCCLRFRLAVCCSVLHCAAEWCSVLQRVAQCCSVLRRVAMLRLSSTGKSCCACKHCNTLQHTTTHCNTQQRVTLNESRPIWTKESHPIWTNETHPIW